jgi:hypothetical protein
MNTRQKPGHRLRGAFCSRAAFADDDVCTLDPYEAFYFNSSRISPIQIIGCTIWELRLREMKINTRLQGPLFVGHLWGARGAV